MKPTLGPFGAIILCLALFAALPLAAATTWSNRAAACSMFVCVSSTPAFTFDCSHDARTITCRVVISPHAQGSSLQRLPGSLTASFAGAVGIDCSPDPCNPFGEQSASGTFRQNWLGGPDEGETAAGHTGPSAQIDGDATGILIQTNLGECVHGWGHISNTATALVVAAATATAAADRKTVSAQVEGAGDYCA